MTQTEVMQTVREMTEDILYQIKMALMGRYSLPLTMPIKLDVWVAYNDNAIQGIKHMVTYMDSDTPMLMLTSDAKDYKWHFSGQSKCQANAKLGQVKWLGVRFDGNRSRMIK